MSRTLLGLDIRNDTVSAVLINGGIKGYFIDTHLTIPIPGDVPYGEGLSAALSAITDQMDLKEVVSFVSLPISKITFRNTCVPFKDHRKIKQVLPLEIEPTLPFPVEDLAFDFQIVHSGDKTDILVGGIEQNLLNLYTDLFQKFKLKPSIVSVGAIPSVAAMIKLTTIPGNSIIVETEGQLHTIFLVDNKKLTLVRTIPRQKSVQEDLMGIATNIRRIIAGYEDLFHTSYEPEAILTTGQSLRSESAENHLSQLLEYPIRPINLIEETDIFAPSHSDISWDSRRLQNTCALIINEIEDIECINFSGRRSALHRQWTEYRPNLITAGLLLGLVLLIALGGVIFEIVRLNTRISGLEKETVAIVKETLPDMENIRDPISQLENRISEMKKSMSGSDRGGESQKIIDILYQMSILIPGNIDVELTRYQFTEDNIVISGSTDTFNSVDEMKNRLEKHEAFKKVTISSANMDNRDKRVKFMLKIDL